MLDFSCHLRKSRTPGASASIICCMNRLLRADADYITIIDMKRSRPIEMWLQNKKGRFCLNVIIQDFWLTLYSMSVVFSLVMGLASSTWRPPLSWYVKKRDCDNLPVTWSVGFFWQKGRTLPTVWHSLGIPTQANMTTSPSMITTHLALSSLWRVPNPRKIQE